MSARVPEPCDVPRGEHEGPARFYRIGWSCAAHANPKPQPSEPEPSGPVAQAAVDHKTT